MATQKRIRALDTYTQLNPGDPGYIAPTAVYLALDSNDFTTEAKKYPFSSLFSSIVEEVDKLTGLASRSVSVTFGTAFTSVPLIATFRVYRMSEISSGKWRMQDVLYYHTSENWLTTTGFSLEIDTSESLTGVVIEYIFREA